MVAKNICRLTFEVKSLHVIERCSKLAVSKSRTGTWDLGLEDSGTRGRGDVGTRGREDAGTWGLGDVGMWGRGDVGTRGLKDVGTQGDGDSERWDASTSELGNAWGLEDVINK